MSSAKLPVAKSCLPKPNGRLVKAVVWNPPVGAMNCSSDKNVAGVSSPASSLLFIPCVTTVPTKNQSPPVQGRYIQLRESTVCPNGEGSSSCLEDKIKKLEAELEKLRAENRALQMELQKAPSVQEPVNMEVDVCRPFSDNYDLSLAELAVCCFLCVLLVCRVIQPRPVENCDEEFHQTRKKRVAVTQHDCSLCLPNRQKRRRCS